MLPRKVISLIFHDLFLRLIVMLAVFMILEWRFAGFVVSYINLNWWFLGTAICGGVYLGIK
jgi:hypothetical protein